MEGSQEIREAEGCGEGEGGRLGMEWVSRLVSLTHPPGCSEIRGSAGWQGRWGPREQSLVATGWQDRAGAVGGGGSRGFQRVLRLPSDPRRSSGLISRSPAYPSAALDPSLLGFTGFKSPAESPSPPTRSGQDFPSPPTLQ